MLQATGTTGERVIEEVAEATDTDVLEQPTLYDVVDPEALDALVEGMSNGEIAFVYAGHQVTVESDGSISLEEQSAGHPTVESPVGDD